MDDNHGRAAEKLMTVDEFLRWDDGTDTRYELVDGQIVAMAPQAGVTEQLSSIPARS